MTVMSLPRQGLFTAAIMESGTCESAEFFISKDRAFLFGQEATTIYGCNQSNYAAQIACLRSKSVQDLFISEWPNPFNNTVPPLAPVMPWGPVIDGTDVGLKRRPIESIKVVGVGSCDTVFMDQL